MGPLQLLSKLQDDPLTSQKVIPSLLPSKPKNSAGGKLFTPYLNDHQTFSGKTKVANTDKWVLSNVYQSYKMIAPLLRKLFPLLFPPN
jgi:hypothetical protein